MKCYNIDCPMNNWGQCTGYQLAMVESGQCTKINDHNEE